jgi:nucleoside-diphosphate-sugar epimerase
MRVAITGGTGFVGAHTVRAVLDAGHDVRLLVRDPARISETLGPLGVGADDVVAVRGDMTDAASVQELVEGADAAIHAAAVVSLEKARGPEVLAANPDGTRIVIDAALAAGADPVLYVSSTASLFRRDLTLLHTDLPPADLSSAYGRSKALAEAWVRARQDEGAPVTITYPAGVVGPPAGPAAGEVSAAVATHLRSGMLPVPKATWSIVDARDIAAVHVACLEAGRGPRRYMCGGNYMSMIELSAIYRELTGRRMPAVRAPGSVFRALGRFNDALGRFVSIDTIFTGEAMDMFTRWCPTDDRVTHEQLGIEWRDPAGSLRETIVGLVAAGRVSAKHAGALARQEPRSTETA